MKQTHDDTQCLAYSGEDNRTIAMLLAMEFGRVLRWGFHCPPTVHCVTPKGRFSPTRNKTPPPQKINHNQIICLKITVCLDVVKDVRV
ncbi:hypothetical protein J7297_04358 [Nakaseomyces glabratus]|nr:hypothetical protein J7296_04351 [Nakaseomyces glabratus]KAH7582738.1 hypothetical protein J7297_04358 [Nakaseomyces glabratus]